MEKDITIRSLRFHYTDNRPSGCPAATAVTSDRGAWEPTIILMHGWGCDHTTLASVESVALQSGYRVVNVDFQGFGKSEEPCAVWGVEDYTCAMEEFIEALGIRNPVLLGHSFGGRVGILYASRQGYDTCGCSRDKAQTFVRLLSESVYFQGYKADDVSHIWQVKG